MNHRLLVSFVVSSVAACALACSGKAPAGETSRSSPMAAAAAAPAPSHVVTEHFHSDALGVDKDVVIYLPRGYDAQSAKHWPVFYYLHGLGGNETNWVKHGQLDAAADELKLDAIVVMPDGDDGFYVDSPSKVDYDQCMKDGTGLFSSARLDADKSCRDSNGSKEQIR